MSLRFTSHSSLFLCCGISIVLLFSCKKEDHSGSLPDLQIRMVTDLTPVSAQVVLLPETDGGGELGVCWDSLPGQARFDGNSSVLESNAGRWLGLLTNLEPGSRYFVRAFLKRGSQVSYGVETSFNTPVYTIGAFFHGGIVFKIDSTGKHGWLAASVDQGRSSWLGRKGYIVTQANSTSDGLQNTQKILIANSPDNQTAAWLSASLELSVGLRWYLPAVDQLAEMFKHRLLIGGFGPQAYWSSTESGREFALLFDFSSGFPVEVDKSTVLSVRAVKNF